MSFIAWRVQICAWNTYGKQVLGKIDFYLCHMPRSNQGSAFSSHSPGQPVIFSNYLPGSHWSFPLECELQRQQNCGLFTSEPPEVSTRSIIIGWTLSHMYTSSKRNNRYLIKCFLHAFKWPQFIWGKPQILTQTQAFSHAHPPCKSFPFKAALPFLAMEHQLGILVFTCN